MSERAIVPAQNGTLAGVTAQTMETVLQGDLSKLTPTQRVELYFARCEAAGLDPRTKPFDYLSLSGKLVLYANKAAAEQAAEKRHLSIAIIAKERFEDIYEVTCRVSDPSGRFTESTGGVAIAGLKLEALANARMKAETKAKRRAVLSFCGLGMLDETEVETIPGAQRVTITEHGEIVEPRPALSVPAGAVTDISDRVRRSGEQSASYAGATVEGNQGAQAQRSKTNPKDEVTALMKALGHPAEGRADFYKGVLAEARPGDQSEGLTADEKWIAIRDALEEAKRDQVHSMVLYEGKAKPAGLHEKGFAQLHGNNPRDRETRLATFAEILDLPHLETSGVLLPSEWATLVEVLHREVMQLRAEQSGGAAPAVQEAEIVHDAPAYDDPFQDE